MPIRQRLHSILKRERSSHSSRSTSPAPAVVAEENKPISSSGDKNAESVAVKPPDTVAGAKENRTLDLDGIWRQAFKKLQQEDSDLADDYSTILADQSKNVHTATKASATRTGDKIAGLNVGTIVAITSHELDVTINKQASKTSKYYEATLKCVIFAKDFINSVAAINPYASVAWAGVSMLLPLLLNPTTQQEELKSGVEAIADILNRHKVYATFVDLSRDASLQEQVVKLYTAILAFFAHAVCQNIRSKTAKYARDVFKADDWAQMMSRIEKLDQRSRDHIDAQHSQNMSTSVHSLDTRLAELSKDMQKLLDTRDGAFEGQLPAALGSFDYEYQKSLNPKRAPGTCRWVLESSTFQDWLQADQASLLWVFAGPGLGKSVLARSCVDEQLISHGSALLTCYFFFKDVSRQARSMMTALSSFIRQMLRQKPDLIEEVRRILHDKDSLEEEMWQALLVALDYTLSHCGSSMITWIVDAVDECSSSDFARLNEVLNHMCPRAIDKDREGARVKILFTTRPYDTIHRSFRDRINAARTIDADTTDAAPIIAGEVEQVIKMTIPRLAQKLDLNGPTETTLRNALLRVNNKTYLWLHLMLHELEEYHGPMTPKKLERFVSEVPESVFDAYDKLLSRNDNAKTRSQALRILQIVMIATRPMTVTELNHAFSIDGSEEKEDQIDMEEDDHFQETARNLCGLMITFTDSRAYLIHQSAKDFLLATERRDSATDLQAVSPWRHTLTEERSHLMMSKTCLRYLILAEEQATVVEDENGEMKVQYRSGPAQEKERKERHKFLDYCLTSWTTHTEGPAFIENKDLLDRFVQSTAVFHMCEQCMAELKRSADWGWTKGMLYGDDDGYSDEDR